MSRYIETIDKITLPVVALHGIVAFPEIALSFELSDEASVKAASAAFEIGAQKSEESRSLAASSLVVCESPLSSPSIALAA